MKTNKGSRASRVESRAPALALSSLPLLLLSSLVIGLSTTTASAAVVRYAWTNSVSAADTNYFFVYPVQDVANADGSFITKGPTIRLTPNASGLVTNTLAVGTYVASNRFLGQGVAFRVPLDNGPTVYCATCPASATSATTSLAISGFNQFVTITYGTNPPPTYDEITNSLGFLPEIDGALTNNEARDVAIVGSLTAKDGGGDASVDSGTRTLKIGAVTTLDWFNRALAGEWAANGENFTNLPVAVVAGTSVSVETNGQIYTVSVTGVGTATNVIDIAAGDNVTIVTNGLLRTISAEAGGGDSIFENNANGFSSDSYNPMSYNTNGGFLSVGAGFSVFTEMDLPAYWEFTRTNGAGTELDHYVMETAEGRLSISQDGEFDWAASFNRTNGFFYAPGYAGNTPASDYSWNTNQLILQLETVITNANGNYWWRSASSSYTNENGISHIYFEADEEECGSGQWLLTNNAAGDLGKQFYASSSGAFGAFPYTWQASVCGTNASTGPIGRYGTTATTVYAVGDTNFYARTLFADVLNTGSNNVVRYDAAFPNVAIGGYDNQVLGFSSAIIGGYRNYEADGGSFIGGSSLVHLFRGNGHCGAIWCEGGSIRSLAGLCGMISCQTSTNNANQDSTLIATSGMMLDNPSLNTVVMVTDAGHGRAYAKSFYSLLGGNDLFASNVYNSFSYGASNTLLNSKQIANYGTSNYISLSTNVTVIGSQLESLTRSNMVIIGVGPKHLRISTLGAVESSTDVAVTGSVTASGNISGNNLIDDDLAPNTLLWGFNSGGGSRVARTTLTWNDDDEQLTGSAGGFVGSFFGNGAGLTNLTMPDPATFGTINATATHVTQLLWSTNLAATVTADLSKNYSFVATNNNVAYTGVTGLSAGDTNVDWTLITITNTSGSAKTIATPASWIDTATGVAGATTYYITNQAYLSIFRYPGAGTNFSYRGGTK